jgi:hypothetical protein
VSAFAMFGTAGRRVLRRYRPVGGARVVRPIVGDVPAALATTKPTPTL